MTIVCRNRNPVDIPLEGIGKIQISSGCKGYSTNAILYGGSTAGSSSVQLPGDLLSQMEFKYACGEDVGIKLNFSQIPAGMAYRKAIDHLDELRLTSARVSDLLDGVSGQDWKKQMVTHHHTHSDVLYLTGSVTLTYWTNKLYFYVRRRAFGCPNVWRVRSEHLEVPQVAETSVEENAATLGGNCTGWRLNASLPHPHMFRTHVRLHLNFNGRLSKPFEV
jgi:hypothetical protein